MSSSQHNYRREFLKTCGKFAAVTPPAATMLLLTSNSVAASGGEGAGPTNTIITNELKISRGSPTGARPYRSSLLATKSEGNLRRFEPSVRRHAEDRP